MEHYYTLELGKCTRARIGLDHAMKSEGHDAKDNGATLTLFLLRKVGR